jgi:hypothetical protein
VATSRLRELGGPDATVFRPSGVLTTQSGDTPGVPFGVTIAFPRNVEDVYQYFHLLQEGDDDNLRDASLWGFFFPLFNVNAALLSIRGENGTAEAAVFDFSENKSPDDGVFLVTAEIVVSGKYRLYSDDTAITSREARVNISTSCSGLSPNYSGAKTLLADGDDNIDVYYRDFSYVQEMSGIRQMKAGEPLYVKAQVSLSCVTKGAAIAELDLSKGVGGVACAGLTLEKVG